MDEESFLDVLRAIAKSIVPLKRGCCDTKQVVEANRVAKVCRRVLVNGYQKFQKVSITYWVLD